MRISDWSSDVCSSDLLLRWTTGPGDGPVCKPGSVEGDHPSTTAVADRLQRPTRALGRAALGRALFGLAPGGVCLAAPVDRKSVGWGKSVTERVGLGGYRTSIKKTP